MIAEREMYTVGEFDDITDSDIGETAFKQLRALILNDGEMGERANIDELTTDASVCMKLFARNGRETIRVKNYVGIISLPCGLTIEVLPKIPFGDNVIARKLVLEMLKACGKIPYKHFQNADLRTERFTLFEIFIRMFIDEVTALYKRGLASGYVCTESNERFIKGKLIITENIKRNAAHAERFYVGYDEFNFNRAENRLIKSTLLYLRDISAFNENRRDLRRICLMFDGIDASDNIERDFACCSSDRNIKRYAAALKLCRVFLRKKSFALYGGQNSAASLLFPMETLYERYIAIEMAKFLPSGRRLSAQYRKVKLFDGDRFPMRPDIVVFTGGEKIVIDTKWKRLNDDKSQNYGISQADMYQMYAYHTRINDVKKVVLLYPRHDKSISIPPYTVKEKNITIEIKLIDLYEYLCASLDKRSEIMQSVYE